MRCAIYARYSSDRQKATSIDDQIRKCRQFADGKSWQVLDRFIFTDEAVSGSRSDRDGFNRMLETAERNPKPFDVLLVDDTSRFARDLPYALSKTELLGFHGIEIHFVAQGINNTSEQFRMMMSVNGIMDEQYVAALAQKTKRGLEGTAIRGNHTGGRCFGYKNVPLESKDKTDAYGRPVIVGARLEIDPEQAEVIRRIFTMYSDGLSLKKIAITLNAERVQSPQPSRGRNQRSWCHTAIRAMLLNERYRGIVVYGKTRKIKNPITKKRIQRAGSVADMVRREFPEQRIISEELWAKVRGRIESVKRVYGERGRKGGLSNTGNGAGNPYIFSGLLKCSECGANLQLVSGKGKNHGAAHYGCPSNAFRGTCSNSLRIRRDALEPQLLAKLQEEILSDDVVEYALTRFETELHKAMRGVSGQMDRLESKKKRLVQELSNLARAVASGLDSAAIRAEIVDRERQIQTITDQVISSKPESVKVKIQDARKFVMSSLRDIRRLLGSADPSVAKALVAQHMPNIVLKPNVKPDGERVYQVVSEWKLLNGGLLLDVVKGAKPSGSAPLVYAEGQS